MSSELTYRILFFDARKVEEGCPGAPDHTTPEDEGAAQNCPASSEAAGSGSSGSGEAGRVEVPDVSDLGVVKAARILSRAGFEVAATKSVSSQREIGTVLRTKPSAGSVVEQETPVVIVTSGGRPGSHQESGAETPVTARALSTQTEAPVRILRWSSGLRGA
jgi:hypothetical protein